MGAKHVTGASAIRIRVVSGGGSAAAESDFRPRMTAVPARVGPRRNSRRLHPFSPWLAMATFLSSRCGFRCSRLFPIDGASGAQPKIETAILTAPHKWTRAISFDHLVGE